MAENTIVGLLVEKSGLYQAILLPDPGENSMLTWNDTTKTVAYVPISASGDPSTWSTYPAIQNVDMGLFTLINLGGATIMDTGGTNPVFTVVAGSDSGVWELLNAGSPVIRFPGRNYPYMNSGFPLIIGATSTSQNDPRMVIAGVIDDTDDGQAGSWRSGPGNNAHAFVDDTQLSRSGNIGYNSFDSRIAVTGTAPFDHVANFQARTNYNSTGLLGRLVSLQSIPVIGNGSIGRVSGVDVRNASITNSTVATQHGLFIESMSGAGTNSCIAIGGQYTGAFQDQDHELMRIILSGGDALFRYLLAKDVFDFDRPISLDEVGVVGSATTFTGAYFAYAPDGVYAPQSGAFAVLPSGAEIHGTTVAIENFKGTGAKQVYSNDAGALVEVEPPAPGWETAPDTDAGSYATGTGTGLGSWVELTGLQVNPVADLSAERLDVFYKLTADNDTTNRTGVIEVGISIDGADPTSGDQYSIAADFTGELGGVLTILSATVTTGQTIGLKVRRVSGSHSSFGVTLDGSTTPHEMLASTPAAGGGGNPATWSSYPALENVDMSTFNLVVADGKGIEDTNGALVLEVDYSAGAVNYVRIGSNSTGNGARVQARGTDTNVDLIISGQGTGKVMSNSTLDMSGNDIEGIGTFDVTNLNADNVNVQKATTGQVSLVAEDVAGDQTATLPAKDGTVALREIYIEKHAASDTLDADQCYGGVHYVTSAATLTLPPAVDGMSLTVIAVGATEATVAANAGDLILLDGVAGSDGGSITNSTDTTKSLCVLTYYDATGWYATTESWTAV